MPANSGVLKRIGLTITNGTDRDQIRLISDLWRYYIQTQPLSSYPTPEEIAETQKIITEKWKVSK